jgi:ribosomal protein S18 acetylase RimI-like enzyme
VADPDLRLRRAGPDDVDSLLAISTGLWQEDAGTHDPVVMNTDWPQQHGRASFEALIDDPDRLGLLAEVGGDLAGGLMGSYPELTPYVRAREARLNSLWVLPDHRGSGVGGLLVDAFLEWARERGAPYAVVTAFAANPAAIKIYERYGFGSHTVTMRTTL